MSTLSINIPAGTKVLIAPLNWGLGHATRCIPIIQTLLDIGCAVSIASDGSPLSLLREEFPSLEFHTLPSYNISYKYGSLAANIFMQLPKLALVFAKEKSRIKKLQKVHQWDVIISDCRYGIYSPSAKNILITHQLNLPFKKGLIQKQANFANNQFLKNFDEIWIPDYSDHRLSGSLSEPGKLKNITYLGALSRMHLQRLPERYDLVVILSGPEPSRSIFEKRLYNVLSKSAYKIAWVRGIEEKWEQNDSNIDVYPRLATAQLNQLINQSKMVISRTGYTTVMDLYSLNKKALLIPTPGQSEQEYLGTWLQDHPLFTIVKEAELKSNLESILKKEMNL